MVGIEVPNTITGTVALRSIIETPAFQRLSARSKLTLALGKGVGGESIVADLAKMPHLLIAGATGSGKSVCLNCIITCLLLNTTPDEVRLLMVDPKRVELVSFNNVPHLIAPVVIEVEEIVKTLRRVTQEMDYRYRRFAAVGARNIDAYNKGQQEPMPYLVVIIDELADVMITAPYEVERTICRLAQLARATGIHLIIATQRPSVDVITGLIKANFPTRISFAVTSQVDSRTILDMAGAEKLLGRGDMLYLPTDAAKPKRVQGAFVSDQEIERVVNHWTGDHWQHLHPSPFADGVAQAFSALDDSDSFAADPLLERARSLAAEHSRISTSLLQRRLRIGYPRAARLMDALEAEGLIGPTEGGRSRQVLIGEDGEGESSK
jgi:S-DNA-T family DNA segregation ATPase FtsK/SpoIIIE